MLQGIAEIIHHRIADMDDAVSAIIDWGNGNRVARDRQSVLFADAVCGSTHQGGGNPIVGHLILLVFVDLAVVIVGVGRCGADHQRRCAFLDGKAARNSRQRVVVGHISRA